MLTDAYAEGREAAFNYADLQPGERVPSNLLCPYAADSPLSQEWQEGWNDAMQENGLSVKPIVVSVPRT